MDALIYQVRRGSPCTPPFTGMYEDDTHGAGAIEEPNGTGYPGFRERERVSPA